MALNTGINSLDAGAPKLRLEGERTAELDPKELWEKMMLEDYKPTPQEIQLIQQYLQMSQAPDQRGVMAAQGGSIGTYTQRRRNQMAGGGIMGSNAGSMLVAPTADGSRPGYADWWNPFTWAEPIKEVAKKVGQTIIPGGETGYIDLYGGAQAAMPTGMPQGSPGQINPVIDDLIYGMPQTQVAGPMDYLQPQNILKQLSNIERRKNIETGEYIDEPEAPTFPTTSWPGPEAGPAYEPDSGGIDWRKALATVLPFGDPGYVEGGLYNKLFESGDGSDPSIARQVANIAVPLGVGKFAHDYQRDWLAKQPAFPKDETGIKFQTAQEAMADPNLRFKPEAQYANVAEGGRIGYAGGSSEYKNWAVGKGLDPADKSTLQKWNEMIRLELDLERSFGKAQGGRIGYRLGEGVESIPTDQMQNIEGQTAGGEYNRVMELMLKIKENIPLTPDEQLELRELMKTLNMSEAPRDQMKEIEGQRAGPEWFEPRIQQILEDNPGMSYEDAASQAYDEGQFGGAQGGRVAAQEGGLMNLGGMEKDYRQEGGFVPIGGQEKADDVPARLSKNEFVFTADAVRAAGGGDIDAGAEVMENVMKNLEAGGEVSEESQGLEGARDMFANAQQLEKRII